MQAVNLVFCFGFLFLLFGGGGGGGGGGRGRGECTKIAVNYVRIIEVDGLLTIARTDRCTLL